MTKAAIPPCFAPGTTSARLSTIRQHTDSRSGRLGFRLYYYIMHCILQKLAQCSPLSGYEENTQRTWSVTLLSPDARLSKHIIRNALDTFRRQTKGSVGVCSDLPDRNLVNEAQNRIHFENGSY